MISMIDYNKKTPYTFTTIELIGRTKYKIIHTVQRGPANSRIINYEIKKYKEVEIER